MPPFTINNNGLPFNPLSPLNGNIPYKTGYVAPVAPLGLAPNTGMYGDMFRDYSSAQHQLKQFSPEQIEAAKNYQYSVDKDGKDSAGMNNITYNLPKKKPTDGFNAGWGGAASAIGAVGTTVANTGRPSVGLGALSGAASGAGYGAILGPWGMAAGAVIGGIAGAASSGTKRSQYDEMMENTQTGKLKAATSFGGDIGEFEHGGNVEGEEGELVPIQTEKGEKIVTVDGSIFNTKSTKFHKQMDSDEITDILVANSYVASNHKSQRISKTTAEKLILGYDTITYDEEGNSSKPTERNLGEMFRKNKMTPAEVLNVVKKTFPTAEVPFDSFSKKSNKLNLKSRLPYINAVIAANLKNK